jgi:putative toxin-antitoxin system antitoxin component (TIGR02293 family)
MTVAAITEVLGGFELLKRTVQSDAELASLTREGLPVDTLTSLATQLGIDRKALARIVGVSQRTLVRRLASRSLLSAEESDRTVRLARVVAMAVDTLGTSAKASIWLQTPNRTLDGEVPLDLLDTDTGARSVETILGRIAYGIYS